MNLVSFLKFVEIQTKVASMIPLSLGTLYSTYRYKSFNGKNFLFMFISLLTFDMATTAINNFIDYKKANKKNVYNFEKHNAMLRDNIKESTALAVIFILLFVAITFGIILVINSSLIVLFIGAASFFIGIIYTFGPIPISRTPFGEIFSGFFMGFIIMFLSIYIHVFDKNIATLTFNNYMLGISINILEIIYIFLVSVPAIVGIANIMLANNICDVDEDIANKRYTLPYYVGKGLALQLFKYLYYIGYLDIIIIVVLKLAPIATLLVLFTIIPVQKNIKLFSERPVKNENFILSVKNFVLMNVAQILIVGVVLLISIV